MRNRAARTEREKRRYQSTGKIYIKKKIKDRSWEEGEQFACRGEYFVRREKAIEDE